MNTDGRYTEVDRCQRPREREKLSEEDNTGHKTMRWRFFVFVARAEPSEDGRLNVGRSCPEWSLFRASGESRKGLVLCMMCYFLLTLPPRALRVI